MIHFRRFTHPLAIIFSLPLLSTALFAQKKPLDHSVYDGWKSIRGTMISRDGNYVAYTVFPQEGDAVGTIYDVHDGRRISVPRPLTMVLSRDSAHLIALQAAPFADTKKAKRAKAKPEDMPKNSLEVVDLPSAKVRMVEKVQSYQIAEEDSGYLLYKPEPPKETKPAAPKKDADDADQTAKAVSAGPKESPAKDSAPDKKAGEPYVLLNLATGKEERIENVVATAFDRAGDVLAYSTSTKDGKGDGVYRYDLRSGKKEMICCKAGKYPKVAISPDGATVAYSTDTDDAKAKKPFLTLYVFVAQSKAPERAGMDSMPKDWSINEGGPIEFSHNGSRVIYRTSPKPQPDPEEKLDDEKVSVDIWNWQDAHLQPEQNLQAKAERERGYLAIYELATKKSKQIGDRDILSPSLSDRGDGQFAVASDTRPYDREASWDPNHSDVYTIDLATGNRVLLAKNFSGETAMSPTGKYIALYDGPSKQWSAIELGTGRRTSLNKDIPTSMADELEDHPDIAPSYGIVGWTKGEDRVLVADRFDIWSCDLSGRSKPRKLTDGRAYSVRYRPIFLDPEERFLNEDHLLLRAFNEDSKQSGVATYDGHQVHRLFMADKAFGGFAKAKSADTLVYTRQDFTEYPDIWLSNPAFESPKKISDANPQQKDYAWGSVELVRWTSLDGVPLQGMLFRPENFDYGKKYPMITYFYERYSDDLNVYRAPAPSASTINIPLFVSNGYCIFVPDIPYKIGYPGESAVDAILPGIQSILGRGYIDPKRMGIQGQSWGGYQVAYLVTRTNMFACAEAGAPVADMFSAYGGIRYGTGIVRQFQYEHSQSRIGGTPWDSTLRYIENSPVFWADKVQTPLMIMSNDKDGAVPHTQGIELFTALRRLDKPSWLVVYNEEDHNLLQRKNRKDLSIRLSQFFDHYLKGAPMPVWMSKGVPAVEKGRTMGTELETPN